MINDRVLHLNFTDVEIILEIIHIVQRVPEAELKIRKALNSFGDRGAISQSEFLDFAIIAKGNKKQHVCRNSVFLAGYLRVSQSVAAFIGIKFGFIRERL